MISTVSERQIIMKCRTEKPHHNNHLESLSLKLLSLLLFLLFFLLFCCRCRRPRCCGNIICKLARTGLCTPHVAYLRDACRLWHPKTNQRHLAACAQQRRLSNIEPPHISRDRETMQEYKKAHQLTGRVPIEEILHGLPKSRLQVCSHFVIDSCRTTGESEPNDAGDTGAVVD